MQHEAIKNDLRRYQTPTPGKVVTASNCFEGHENRMAAHIRRVWNHPCERTDDTRCRDCIRRTRR